MQCDIQEYSKLSLLEQDFTFMHITMNVISKEIVIFISIQLSYILLFQLLLLTNVKLYFTHGLQGQNNRILIQIHSICALNFFTQY